MNKTIYLCGPIHGKTDAECRNWREAVKAEWPHKCLDPMVRDARGKAYEPGIEKRIVEADKADIDSCGAVLVYFVEPSVGTSMEILYAWMTGKPVVVVNASMKPHEEVSLWIRYHAKAMRYDIVSALAHLELILN